jgi:hypothetical protein
MLAAISHSNARRTARTNRRARAFAIALPLEELGRVAFIKWLAVNFRSKVSCAIVAFDTLPKSSNSDTRHIRVPEDFMYRKTCEHQHTRNCARGVWEFPDKLVEKAALAMATGG